MKKFITLLLLAFSFGAFAQNVDIPSANFKVALLNHTPVIDIDGNREISFEEAEEYNGTLNLSSKNIYGSLKGIEAFVNITRLYCGQNNITSFDVSKNVNLTSIICSKNKLTKLNVSRNTQLTILRCDNNRIDSLDVSGLSKLELLHCHLNIITKLDVAGAINLKELTFFYNQVKSLDLTDNINLLELSCKGNPGINLNLSNNIKLEELFCPSCDLHYLDLSNNINLKKLYCHDNKLKELNLSKNLELTTVNCSVNELTEICVATTHNTSWWKKDASAQWSTTCQPLAFSELQSTEKAQILKAYNLQGQEVPLNTKGEVIILLYDNGVREKTYVAE